MWALKQKMSNYGLPYMGSKSKLAKYILHAIPSAENFYDLFGGGFSITHFAAQEMSHKWKYFHFNEIKEGQCDFIKDAIAGKYNYKNFLPKFIDREEFKKSNDPYVKIIWSFGNNCKQYLFNPDTEKKKRSLHNAVVFNEFDDYAKNFMGFDKFEFTDIKKRRLALKRAGPGLRLEELERLQSLQQLQQLERLERLERQIEFSSLSYDQVEIKDNSVIYCDPPYAGTAKYSEGGFDHGKFFDWALNNKHPVFISEYKAPKDFKLIKCFSHRSTLSSSANNGVYEKLFANAAGHALFLANK